MADSAAQRRTMVESQVRPSDVTDRRITSAMRDVVREQFVPAALTSLAYMEEALSVAPGRQLMAPRAFARLVQLADIRETDKVLIVGALLGYSAAVAARLAGSVVALEATGCETVGLPANVTLVIGPLHAGWEPLAPFDVIVIEGGFEVLPPGIIAQLSPAGRLVGIDTSERVGQAVIIQRVGPDAAQAISRRVAFDAGAVCLPGLERAKSFQF